MSRQFFKKTNGGSAEVKPKKETSLWVEKYRPDSLDTYIGNDHIKAKFSSYIENQDFPHLLLYAGAGTGKTTLGKILVNSIDCDYLYINASSENNVATVRTKITNYASVKGFSKWKVIFLDEADYITPEAQAALRNIMETFHTSTRFILTCNYVERMIEPIQSRCQEFNVNPPKRKEVAQHLMKILTQEKIKHDISDIKILVDSAYPDIRKVINSAQQNVIGDELKLNKQDIIESDVKLKLVELLKSNKSPKDIFTDIRQLIANSHVSQYEELYSFLYDKVDEFSNGNVGMSILTIAEYEQSSALVVNKNISFMACIYKLLEIINE
jgi:replication factor C small subunit